MNVLNQDGVPSFLVFVAQTNLKSTTTAVLQHYLSAKHLIFRGKNNSITVALMKEIWFLNKQTNIALEPSVCNHVYIHH